MAMLTERDQLEACRRGWAWGLWTIVGGAALLLGANALGGRSLSGVSPWIVLPATAAALAISLVAWRLATVDRTSRPESVPVALWSILPAVLVGFSLSRGASTATLTGLYLLPLAAVGGILAWGFASQWRRLMSAAAPTGSVEISGVVERLATTSAPSATSAVTADVEPLAPSNLVEPAATNGEAAGNSLPNTAASGTIVEPVRPPATDASPEIVTAGSVTTRIDEAGSDTADGAGDEDFASGISADVVQQATRRRGEDGSEIVEAVFRMQFAAGARTAVIHLPLWPNLAGEISSECMPLDDADVRVEVTSAKPYGVRVEAQRDRVDAPLDVLVGVQLYAAAAADAA